jgi:acetyl esterase/lipase
MLLGAFGTIAQTERGTAPLPSGREFKNLVYVPGGHERHQLDLYLPDSASPQPFPLVIWIHGGAWRQGSKDRCPARFLLQEGFAVASINYRLSQHAIYPAQIQDCKTAVRWLRAHAGQYGLDPDHFGAWGSSAGGHLAALLGTTGHVDAFDLGPHPELSSRVQAVCDFFGPTDFLRMNDHPGRMDHNAPDSPESQLVGGPIQEHPEKTAQANPVTHVAKDAPPFLIMHGDRDPLVPYQQSELLDKKLRAAGVPSELVLIKGAGHGFKARDTHDKVRQFFLKQLKPESD